LSFSGFLYDLGPPDQGTITYGGSYYPSLEPMHHIRSKTPFPTTCASDQRKQKALSSGLCSGLIYPEMLGAACPLMLHRISEDMYLQQYHSMRTSDLTNF